MNKILDLIKNFKYKVVTSIALLILTQAIYYIWNIVWVSYISLAAFLYLIARLYVAMYYGIKNTYKNGDKGLAIGFTVLLILMTLFILFLTFR
jgi:hypothetical protein